MLKKVFASFDYETARRYKFILEASNANPRVQFVFDDATPREIKSYNIGHVKAILTSKIISVTHALVVVGQEANKLHKDYKLIGFLGIGSILKFTKADYMENGLLGLSSIDLMRLPRSCLEPEQLGR